MKCITSTYLLTGSRKEATSIGLKYNASQFPDDVQAAGHASGLKARQMWLLQSPIMIVLNYYGMSLICIVWYSYFFSG
jgi:hypothetical protein